MPETVATASKSNWIISIWHSSLFWNLSKGVCQDLLGLPNTGQPELPSIFIAKGEEMRGESALCLLYKKCRYMSILFTKKWPLHSGLFYLLKIAQSVYCQFEITNLFGYICHGRNSKLTKELDLTLDGSDLHTLISADKPCNVRTQTQVRRNVPLYMIERERDVEDSNNSPFHITPLVTRIVADVIKEVCWL